MGVNEENSQIETKTPEESYGYVENDETPVEPEKKSEESEILNVISEIIEQKEEVNDLNLSTPGTNDVEKLVEESKEEGNEYLESNDDSVHISEFDKDFNNDNAHLSQEKAYEDNSP